MGDGGRGWGMETNFRRGFFWAWLTFALVWLGLIGWLEYPSWSWQPDVPLMYCRPLCCCSRAIHSAGWSKAFLRRKRSRWRVCFFGNVWVRQFCCRRTFSQSPRSVEKKHFLLRGLFFPRPAERMMGGFQPAGECVRGNMDGARAIILKG